MDHLPDRVAKPTKTGDTSRGVDTLPRMTLWRKARLGLAAFAVVAVGALVAPSPANATGYYDEIYNVHSHQCITYVRATSLFVQEPCDGDTWQQFTFWSASTGGFLLNVHGVCMDAPAIGNGVQIVGVFCNLKNSQPGSGWALEGPTISVNIGGWVACLDLENGTTLNGQPMQIWNCNPNTDNQRWDMTSI
jgi:Ricin-type beta-trefoil lectin domain